MFAIAAAVVFFLMSINVSLGSLQLVWLALAFLCLHLAFGTVIHLPTFSRRNPE